MPTVTVSRHRGVNLKDARFELEDGQYRKLQNLLSGAQALEQRPGRTRLLTNISANPVTGLLRFYRGAGGGNSAGPSIAGTGAEDASYGTKTWTNPGNITAEDNQDAKAYTGASGTDDPTRYLKATNFGFAVDVGATIVGIEVIVRRNASREGVFDDRVRIVKGGAVQTADRAKTEEWDKKKYVVVTYGGPEDLWGTTWLPADVNGATFGMVIAAKGSKADTYIRVEHVKIKVYFRLGAFAVSTETLAFSGTSLFSDKTAAWASISGANPLSSGKLLSMAPWKNKVYIQDGVNGPYQYDGTTFSVWTGAPLAKVMMLDRERLYAGNLVNRPDGAYAVAACDLDNADVWTPSPSLSTHGIVVYFGKGDGDAIVGFGRVGSLKYILKAQQTYVLEGDDLNSWQQLFAFPAGAVNPFVISVCGDTLAWTDGRRAYAHAGGAPLDLAFGRDIEPWLEGITYANWQTYGWSVFWNGYYILGNGLAGEAYVRDFRNGEWYGPWTISGRCAVVDRDTDLAYIGAQNTGDVYKLTGTTDDGVAISWEAESKAYGHGMDEWEKRARRLWVVADGGIGTVTAKARADDDSGSDVTRTLAFSGSVPQTKPAILSGPKGIHHSLILSGSGVGKIYEYGQLTHPLRAVSTAV